MSKRTERVYLDSGLHWQCFDAMRIGVDVLNRDAHAGFYEFTLIFRSRPSYD